MKYYIATSFTEQKLFKLVDNLIQERSNGQWELTHDWTGEDATQVDKYELYALRSLDGIDKADHIFVLLPGGRGTHIELGYAIAKNKWISIISLDSNIQDSVFYNLQSPIIERYEYVSDANPLETIIEDIINVRS